MALVESFSGIRGIYDKDLTESIAIRYIHAFSAFLKNKAKKNSITSVIGTDTRPSGLKLCDAIIGTIDCSFIDVGILPTPAIEFAVRHFGADGGIIITASHNEPYWNGFKFLDSSGAVLNEKDMDVVISNAKFLKNFHKIQEREVREKNPEALKGYSNFLFEVVGKANLVKIKSSGQKIVIDPNGGTGIAAKKSLEQAGVSVVGVNVVYGEFRRTVEPTEDSMFYLKNVIEESNADFAAGFDCDADRVEVLLPGGQFVSGNQILALAVDEILSNSKNPANDIVVVNDATSGVVRQVAEKYGAKIKEVEVGETNVVKAMEKFKSKIGGEGSSGGVIIAPSKCRDGILTLLMLMSIIAKKGKRLSDIVDGLPRYHYIRKNVEFNPRCHDKIKSFIKKHYTNKGFGIAENSGSKGSLKVTTGKNSFVWFRASKTEADSFRIISDSDKKVEAEKLMEGALDVFKKANEQK